MVFRFIHLPLDKAGLLLWGAAVPVTGVAQWDPA